MTSVQAGEPAAEDPEQAAGRVVAEGGVQCEGAQDKAGELRHVLATGARQCSSMLSLP